MSGTSISGTGIMDMRALSVRLHGADRDLRARLRKEFKQAAGPVVRKVQNSARTMPVHGTTGDRPPSMLEKIAGTVSSSVRTTPDGARLSIISRGERMPPGMEHLPVLTNRPRGFGHPVYARGSRSRWNWAHQIGKPEWFDRPISDSHGDLERAVEEAVRGMCRHVEG